MFMRFIGNKTQLLDQIKNVVDKHVADATTFCDIFSGTASVARYFKRWYRVYSNDLLYFSYCLQRGTVEASHKPSFDALKATLDIKNPISYFNSMATNAMEILPKDKRFFQNSYAPTGGRMYMTDSNALRIDFARNTVESWKSQNILTDDEYYINGTYGSFSKTWDKRTNKVFQVIDLPVLENGKNNKSFNEYGAELLKKIHGDILYIDPPYNERQYLPNYHVLETAGKYDFPVLKGITGQRANDSQRSDFCSKRTVVSAFEAILKNADFKHIILSYNTDGIMTTDEIETVMKEYGIPKTFEINYVPYRRFKSQTKATRNNELKEMLIYIRKDI